MSGVSVYLFSDGRFQKIGISANPAGRLQDLNTPLPLQLKYSLCVGRRERALKIERLLHTHYRNRHVNREWFQEISVDDFKARLLAFYIREMRAELDSVQKWAISPRDRWQVKRRQEREQRWIKAAKEHLCLV